MAINLGGGFHIGSKQPIDDRLIMTKSEMLNVNENTFPDFYMCVCSDDGAIYTFNVSNEANDKTGKFRIIESGTGAGGEVDLTGLFMTNAEITTMLDDIFGVSTTAYYSIVDKDDNILVDSEDYELTAQL